MNMAEYKHYTDEQKAQAYNSDVLDFARTHGFELKQVGNEYKIPHMEGLTITPSVNMWSWHSRPPAPWQSQNSVCLGGKGAVSFAQGVMGLSYTEALREVIGEPNGEYKPKQTSDRTYEQKEKAEFVIPEKYDAGYKALYSYLIKTRQISSDVVREFCKAGILYPTKRDITAPDGNIYTTKINAVFLHINENGEPSGADLQGLDKDPQYRFKSCTSRDESDNGFVYNKGDLEKIDTVYLFEAEIDLMSFIDLHPEIENAKFVAMSGLKPTIAEHYINSDMNVVSCVDNDIAGERFNSRILHGKMQGSLTSNGEDITVHKINRDPPGEFLNASVNGKECSIFMNKEEYKAARESGAEISRSAFMWINKSNFTVNRECAEAGVKDFNDLLKKTKNERAANIDEQNIAAVEHADKWADKVHDDIAAERSERSRQKNDYSR